MTKHVLLALTSHGELGDTGRPTGYTVSEAAHPAAMFAKFGYEIDFVSVRGGAPPMDGADSDDPLVKAYLKEPEFRAKLADTPTADSLNAADFDAILFVGGHGTMWDFPTAASLLRLGGEIYDRGGVVGAVCHGPAALTELRLGDGTLLAHGRKVSGFTNEEEAKIGLTDVVPFLLEDRLKEVGAIYRKSAPWAVHTESDERLVTGQNAQSATRVGELIVEALGGH